MEAYVTEQTIEVKGKSMKYIKGDSVESKILKIIIREAWLEGYNANQIASYFSKSIGWVYNIVNLKGMGMKRSPYRSKHGMCETLEYRTWYRMKLRCLDPKDPVYNHYGGRGITICERWLNNFLNFFADMGVKPSRRHSLDRVDVNGNYEPSNCRWATDFEQQNNRTNSLRLTINGVTKTVSEWAREKNVPYHRIYKTKEVRELIRKKKLLLETGINS